MFNYSFEFHPIANPTSSVLAFADLIVEDTFKVLGFKIMKNTQTNELWVAPPQEKSEKKDDAGNAKYFPRVYWVDAKIKEDDFRTKAQEEVYAELVKAFAATTQTQTRQGAAKQHADRNSTDATGGKAKLWNRGAV